MDTDISSLLKQLSTNKLLYIKYYCVYKHNINRFINNYDKYVKNKSTLIESNFYGSYMSKNRFCWIIAVVRSTLNKTKYVLYVAFNIKIKNSGINFANVIPKLSDYF